SLAAKASTMSRTSSATLGSSSFLQLSVSVTVPSASPERSGFAIARIQGRPPARDTKASQPATRFGAIGWPCDTSRQAALAAPGVSYRAITICTTPFTCCLRRASRSTHRAASHAPPASSIDRKDTALYYRFMGGACASGPGQQNADDLLPLALSRPQEALTEAHAVLAEQPGPYPASVAHQAAGIVLRDTGDVSAGVRELRAALRLARRTGSTEREADVLATLGLTLTYARRTAAGLAAFDRALDLSSGAAAGRVRYRRAVALWRLGRYAAALEDLRRAADVLQGANDPVWMSRTLNGRGLVYLAL